MKAFAKERRISILIQLCLGLSGVGALTVNIPQPQYEFARGDNVTLPCTFTTRAPRPLREVIVTWLAYVASDATDERTTIISYYYSSKHTDIKKEYEGRLSLDVDVNTGKANLKISSITLADNENFECRLLVPGDDEGQPTDSTRLVVLVAPSKPICTVQGTPEYGQNINLTCLSKEGSPPPTYTWSSKDVQNNPRPIDPTAVQKEGILSLRNISKDTSGYFTCVSRNKIRFDTCNLTLSVMPPSMNIGSTAGIIGGVVAALIALVIIIYCCCRCRKKNKEEEYAMRVHEDDYHDEESNPEKQDKTRSYDDSKRPGDGRDRDYDRRRDYDDRRSDYDDRRSDYDDRRSDYNDRRSDYDDRRSDYNDRRRDYDDRRSDYDDRRSDYDDRRSDYNDRRSDYNDRRYDDDRHYNDRRDPRYAEDDRYDEPYESRDRDSPPVPANKPPRRDHD